MRDVVKDVALNFPTAIVTGRSIDKVHYIILPKILLFFVYVIKSLIYILILNMMCFCLQVRSFVKVNEIYYAGSHGMDIESPTNENSYGQVRKQCTKIER